MSADALACECEEHPTCKPVPGQTERYRVNIGPFDQGVVKLCPWCFVNGCMWMKEMRWRMKRDQYQAAQPAEEATSNG